MTTRRLLPRDGADLVRALVPLGLLVVAAVVDGARPVVLPLLAVGAAIAIRRSAPVAWAWAGAVPVALALAWGALTRHWLAVDPASCTDPANPVASLRAMEAVLVLATVGVLAMVLRASAASILLRLPARRWTRLAVLGFVVAGPVAIVVGPVLAAPFFGDVSYRLVPAALLPALVFALSNGVAEEVAYRGALLGWSARVVGAGPAVVGQAVVFGLAHSGADVLGGAVPLMLAMGVGGLLAGIVALRTRSLLLPTAVHVGLDLPIYLALACPP
ncbi:MAG: CPBP family intramembrane glutamic endopeptidase [Candidatus Limnocylindria bacterium]